MILKHVATSLGTSCIFKEASFWMVRSLEVRLNVLKKKRNDFFSELGVLDYLQLEINHFQN